MIRPDRPWEGWVFMYGSVLRDEGSGRFRMWYQSWNQGLNYKVCFAESTDGIHWEKPELGLVEFEGNRKNNILIPGCAMPNVFPSRDENGGLQLFTWAASHPDRRIHRHSLFHSQDGLNWRYVGRRKFGPDGESGRWIKDANVIRWDERHSRWSASHRSWTKFPIGEKNGEWRRTVSLSHSQSLLSGWSQLELQLKPDSKDDVAAAKKGRRDDRPDWGELYGMPVYPVGNHEIGLLSILDLIDGSDRIMGGGRMELAFSHDGRKWMRPELRSPCIESDPKRPGMYPIYAMTTPLIRQRDRLWCYYTEANSMHPTVPLSDWKTCIRLATWRDDGFVSLRAEQTGEITTRLLQLEPGELMLNVKVRPGGSIRVAVLDQDGAAMSGYALTDSRVQPEDSVALKVRWKGNTRLPRWDTIRLKIELQAASLWSFRVSSE